MKIKAMFLYYKIHLVMVEEVNPLTIFKEFDFMKEL